jgi:hypothetical protein
MVANDIIIMIIIGIMFDAAHNILKMISIVVRMISRR